MTTNARAWAHAGLDAATFKTLAAELPPSELWSLLLEVMHERSTQRQPAEVLRQWERDGFTRPAQVDQRTALELDTHLFRAANTFEAIELSPLAPLATCSSVGLASQNKIVSALRGTEVVSDPTNVMALECARRLKAQPNETVRLATSHRCVRAQEIPKKPGFAPHFRMFAMATAGREQKDHTFVVSALSEHIHTHLAAIRRIEQHGYKVPARSVRLLATPQRQALAERIAASLTGERVSCDVLEHNYYDGLRFLICIDGDDGTIPFVDGGCFDWLTKLLSNQRMVFVASGMGSQLAALLWREAKP